MRRKGQYINFNFEYFIEQNKFKRIGLKAGMLIESPLLTNHICSKNALKIVIQSALIPMKRQRRQPLSMMLALKLPQVLKLESHLLECPKQMKATQS